MLYTVFFVLFSSGGLYALGSKNYRHTWWIAVLAALMLLNVAMVYFDHRLPLELLYGPLLYQLKTLTSKKTINQKEWLAHLMPYIFLGVFQFSHPVYLGTILCSLLVYGYFIRKPARVNEETSPVQQMIFQLNLINFSLAFFVVIRLLMYFQVVTPEDIGFNINILAVGLHLLATLYLFQPSLAQSSAVAYENEESTLIENHDILKGYATRLEALLELKKLHLMSSLSLADLSKELNIPKHHLSRVFNAYYKKPYYQYIAERRVREAVNRLESEQNIKLESLAYECGFNSKTTFNKYFKDIVGETPSEYRARIN